MGSSEKDMVLEVWGGNWGMPSVDYRCLAVMAYCKFGKVPINISYTNNPWKSPSGELPVLRLGSEVEVQVNSIFNLLRKENCGADHNLTTKQSADIVAFIAMMEEKLVPALLHVSWVEAESYLQLTRPWYAAVLPFPLNYFLPGARRRHCQQRLRCCADTEMMTDEEIEKKVYADATECLDILSLKLSDQNYFFGRTPSSLDAVVFGCVAPLFNVPFPRLSIQKHLQGCQNLRLLCDNILHTYFPISPQGQFMNLRLLCDNILHTYFPISPQEENRLREARETQRKTMTGGGVSSGSVRTRDLVIVAVVTAAIIAAAAFYTGLISVEVVDVIDEDDSETPQPPNFDQFDDLFDDEEQDAD